MTRGGITWGQKKINLTLWISKDLGGGGGGENPKNTSKKSGLIRKKQSVPPKEG